jgi:autotransporter-associated beta strand protein
MNKFCTMKCKILSVLTAALALANLSRSASIDNWAGPSPGTTTSPASGNWDTASLNWTTTSGLGNAAFATGNTVTFAGADGAYAINVPASLSAAGIYFTNSGYLLASSTPVTITTTGSAAANVASGKTAIIGTNLTLNITANGSYVNQGTTLAGQLIITNGGTITQPNAFAFAVDGAPGSMLRVLTGGVASHTGAGSAVRIGYTAGSSGILSIEGGTFNNSGSASFVLSAGAPSTGTVSVVSGKLSVPKTPIVIGNTTTSVATNNLNGGVEIAQQIKTGSASATSVLNFNGGTLQDVNPGVSTLTNAFLIGLTAANIRNNGGTIDYNGTSIIVGQALLHSTIPGDAATDGGLLVANSGVGGALSLTNANTYNGPTVVANGANLIITTRSAGGGAYTASDGGKLDVQVVSSGATLAMSSLTLGTSGNVTNIFELGANASTTTPAVTVGGALNLNGTANVTVTATGLTAPNTYVLMSYGSLTGTGSFVLGSVPAITGYIANVVNNTAAQQLQLVYTAAPQPVRWAVGNGNWDTTSLNWQLLSGSGLTNYNEGSLAAFDDSATGTSPITVTLAGTRSPSGITNNSTKNYLIAGNYSLGGGGVVTKNGSGTLILDNGNANNFASVSLNSGTLQVGNGDTGGSLGSGPITNNGVLAFNRTDSPSVAASIAGSGSLVQNGSGSVTLGGANSYSGLTTINSGALVLANSGAVQNSLVSNNVVNGLGFASGITAVTVGGLAGAGNLSLLNAASAAVTVTLNDNNTNTAYSGSLGGNGSLLQAGTNSQALSGNLALSLLQVTANGTIAITGGNSTISSLQIAANSGSLQISGGNMTVTTDSRIAAANGVYNVSGGTLNLNKLTLGSAAAGNTNNVMTVSGDAVVNQNQPGGGNYQQLWIGGNNAGSGALALQDNAQWVNTNTALNDVNGNPIVAVGRAINSSGATGSLTLSNNAAFTYSNVVQVAVNDASGSGVVGTVNLSGGNIFVTGFSCGTGIGTINAAGGTITALASSANFFSNFGGTGGANSVNLQSGGLTFNPAGNAAVITNVLSGVGGLAVLGNGVLTLTGVNTYGGATAVSGGTLLVNGSLAAASAVTVTNATLGGSGTIGGSATLQPSSVLAAGNGGIGSLTFGGALTLNAYSTNNFAVTTAGGASNSVAVFGLLTPNSSVVSVTSGTPLYPGAYPLFTYGASSGSFQPAPLFDVPPVHPAYVTNNGAGVIYLVVPNRPPVAQNFTLGAVAGISSTIQVIGGKYAPVDPDGDALIIASVSGGTNGTATTDGTNITYIGTNGAASSDTITYTISDGYGGTAVGTVSIVINSAQGYNQISVQVVGGNVLLTYMGIPGYQYALDWTPSLAQPIAWMPVTTNTAATNGFLNFTNSTLSDGSAFYRTRYVP